MKAMRLLALPLIIAASIVTGAQDAPKPPFEWKVSGDTVEAFKLEFTANRKVDQSSAKALVESYAAYTDNRESTSKAMDVVGDKWDAALAKSLRTYESKLLTAEFLKKRDDARAKDEGGEITYSEVRGEEKVTEVGEDEYGVNWVLTTQSVKIRKKDWQSREWNESTEDRMSRYTVMLGEDGAWRIERIEVQQQQVDMEGNVKKVWKEQNTMLDFMLFYRRQYENRKELPALKQDTPENAALSLFANLIPKRDELGNSIHSKGLKAWTDKLEGMFTKANLDAKNKKFEEWAKDSPAPVKREIDSTSDGADGAKVVKFKKRDDWSDVIEVRLKKVDGAWKIVDAGFWKDALDKSGKQVKEFVSEPDVYNLSWR